LDNYFNKNAINWDKEQYRTDRAKIVANEIKSIIKIHNLMSIMDFGCGTGLLGSQFIDFVHDVCFIDSSHEMLKQVIIKNDNLNNKNYLTFNNIDSIICKFDLIVNLMVFHHIENISETFEKLVGMLKKQSYFVFCDLELEDGSFHEKDLVPHNGFEIKSIKKLFAVNNLTIIHEKQVYINKKIINGKEKTFPVFLLIGKSA